MGIGMFVVSGFSRKRQSPVPHPRSPLAFRLITQRMRSMVDTLEIPRVLVADNQPAILEALQFLLGNTDFELDLVTSMDTVRERVADARYDLLLMDLNYARDTTSGREGLDLLTEIHDRDRGLPIVVMTGWGNIDTAVDAMRRGARSFVQKPWDNAALLDVVTREVSEGRRSRRADVRARHDRDEATRIQRALLPSTLPSISRLRPCGDMEAGGGPRRRLLRCAAIRRQPRRPGDCRCHRKRASCRSADGEPAGIGARPCVRGRDATRRRCGCQPPALRER